jgi:hypothetical protein
LGSFFCTSHILVISLSLYLIKWRTPEEEKEAHTNKPMLLPSHLLEVSKLKKRRPHSTFSHTLCLLLSYLDHSDEDPSNRQRKRLKTPHRSTKVEDRLPTLVAMFLFISLLLVSSFLNLKTRFRLRGVDLSHPEIYNFRM